MELIRVDNGLNIINSSSIDFENINDELIDNIFEINKKSNSIYDDFIDSEFAKNICSYKELIKSLLKSVPKKDRKGLYKNLNTVEFVNNVRKIFNTYDRKVTKEEIAEIFKKNKKLFTYNIQNIKGNYKYLKKFNILLNDELDKIYLNSSIINIDDKISEIILNKEKIPKHLEQLLVTTKNKEQLEDNLKYIVKVNGLRTAADVDKRAMEFFNRSLIDNVIAYDSELLEDKSYFLEKSKYSHYFAGIKSEIANYLNHINPNLLKDLDNLVDKKEFEEFFQSLNCVKKWDSYQNEVERITDLRDEFITRILFGSIWDNCLNYRNKVLSNEPDKKEDTIIKDVIKSLDKEDNKLDYLNSHINELVLMNITCDDLNAFFDININQTKFKAKVKESLRATIFRNYPPSHKFINQNPYLQNREKDYNLDLINRLKYDLLNPQINKEIKERIMEDTTLLMKKYSQTNGQEKNKLLTNIIKSLNYYMIANNEYDILNYRQKNTNIAGYVSKDVTHLPRQMLNTKDGKFKNKYNSMDRIMYFLYNSNRLAHSAGDTKVYTTKDDPLVVNENRGLDKNKKAKYMVKYTTLSRYGLSVDWINSSIEDYFSNKRITIFNYLDKYKFNTSKIVEYLNTVSVDDNTIFSKEEITQSNIKDVIDTINSIKDNPKNNEEMERNNKKIRDSIEIYAKERSFLFNVKRFFIEEVVRRTANASKKDLENMTKDDKVKLFDNKGYVAEFQSDRKSEDVVLVCLNKNFNTPFSVHYVNKSRNFEKEKLNNEVSHSINQIGLTENESKYVFDNNKNKFLKAGFYEFPKGSINQEEINNTVSTYNFINFNLEVSKNKYSFDKAFQKLKEITKVFNYIPNSSNKKDGDNIQDYVSNKAHESIKTLMNTIQGDPKISITPKDQLSINGTLYEVKHNNEKILLTKDDLGENIINEIENKSGRKR